MPFSSERAFEHYIRRLIKKNVSKAHPTIYALKNNKAVDIVVCKDGPRPALFFIEIKYHKAHHGRIGFGSSKGGGFQPEIIGGKVTYFEKNLRWILANDESKAGIVQFLKSKDIRKYVAGGVVKKKFNNIQTRVFSKEPWLTEKQLVKELRVWFGISQK